MFADDLCILAKADHSSLLVIDKVLQQFKHLSGLGVSYQKCEIFIAGVDVLEQNRLASTINMTLGELQLDTLGSLLFLLD